MILHGYWRSTTSYRLRIALNLKGVAYEHAPLDLRTGAQRSKAFRALNPQGLVPVLEVDGTVLTQSPAIIEWLEELHPDPPLLPADATARAMVRAMAALIGCDMHPLNNLRVLEALRGRFNASPEQVSGWITQWIAEGFAALEVLVARHGAGFAYGAAPSIADCYLVPQVYSASRFGVDLTPYPRLLAASEQASRLSAFVAAHPDRQAGADP